MPTDGGDWLLFLSLEKDLLATFDYVPIHKDHYGVYSFAYLKILLVACSAIEQLGKEYCKQLGVENLPDKPSIYRVRDGIINKNGRFRDTFCYMPRFDQLLGKFFPWADDVWNKEGGPPWWQAYNNSKHNAYECATQRNVIDCLAALFCLNVACYGKRVGDFDPQPALYYDQPNSPTYLVGTTLAHEGPGNPIIAVEVPKRK
jgi:hypothetical protein